MDLTARHLDLPTTTEWRKSLQPLLPVKIKAGIATDAYDMLPLHNVGKQKIFSGYASLATWIQSKKFVALDGYVGIFWDEIKNAIADELGTDAVRWISTVDYMKSPAAIDELVAPFVGSNGSVWGTRTRLTLRDFFNDYETPGLPSSNEICIVAGPGAALLAPNAAVAYVDLPKSEIQWRMRAGTITNLGSANQTSLTEMYKRFYFVDWVVLNEHKKNLLPKMEIIIDGQWQHTLNWMKAADFNTALKQLAHSPLRVRPWFEPGAWGGQWIKEHIPGINKEEINYAWSFELIVPENGIVFESDGYLMEASFDFLMFAQRDAVLGKYAPIFGDEFPIRFDFLDTWDGGNLSIQCHPTVPYIRKHFGETLTQDETYYILDCQPSAQVYLGFQEDIDPTAFRNALENSRDNSEEIDITRYVQSHAASKHDLFLIPNGTIHSAGAGNLVLEISATPYIFTFKMYDWLRLDLNGEPRAINIEHAFNNLNFQRKGDRVVNELLPAPVVVSSGGDWQIVHLPTHAEHFYDVERIEFDSVITLPTNDSCQVMMLVEGDAIYVETADGTRRRYHYAETFVVPAAANSFTVTNAGNTRAKLIKAFIKPSLTQLHVDDTE